MNILFEIETERVKGIALHPTAPYVLIGCIDGFVQLYNYESRECLHVCEELGRPVNMRAVRAVCFHAAKPLFAAGGNDGVVRVYNYVEHTCVASLRLHADYVRSLSFHASRPSI